MERKTAGPTDLRTIFGASLWEQNNPQDADYSDEGTDGEEDDSDDEEDSDDDEEEEDDVRKRRTMMRRSCTACRTRPPPVPSDFVPIRPR
ncbi:hypothetical protein niasHS_004305 [Heterodera schachtii]|uniref:Uncharacterized protein n=1 Tax=Heterodera schachtii TaxID=97005 RepID=A0ABD2JVG6_HETSC